MVYCALITLKEKIALKNGALNRISDSNRIYEKSFGITPTTCSQFRDSLALFLSQFDFTKDPIECGVFLVILAVTIYSFSVSLKSLVATQINFTNNSHFFLNSLSTQQSLKSIGSFEKKIRFSTFLLKFFGISIYHNMDSLLL